MQRIGLFGGTFDPVHNGHLLMAGEVLNTLQLDEIWFLPNKIPPHKQDENTTSSTHRVAMLELATNDNEKFVLSTFELDRQGPSYTYDTIMLLKEEFPNVQFYFIIGADMVEFLPNWYNIDELIQIIQFVGVGRPGYDVKSPYPVMIVEAPQIDISSTMIRDKMKHRKNVDYILPASVKKYIEENHLYES
jgi:nicotinate-nucleotide adenylyltransferase